MLVAFVFKHDCWHQASCNCLSSSTQKYVSLTVKGEARNRIGRIREDLQGELLPVLYQIRRKRSLDVPSLSDLGWIVSLGNGKRIKPLLNQVAQEAQKDSSSFNQIEGKLRNALHVYLLDTHQGEKQIMKRINPQDIIPWARRRQYPAENRILKTNIKNLSDVEILLDAHDLSLNENLDKLEFVTGDKKDILKNEKIILSTLKISGIKYLAAFNSAS